MQNIIKDFLSRKVYAIQGSFRDKSKYAYQILCKLKDKGYKIYPVNPAVKEVEGLRCYRSVKDIPEIIDVVNIVTPPKVTEKIVRECKAKGIKRVWIQPGAESEDAIKFCKDNDIDVICGLCVMVETL